jgi:succinoglycan biosynthesis transport protein ExoP
MLQRTEQNGLLPFEKASAPRSFDFVDAVAFLKANRRIIAGWVIAAVAIALVYAFTATRIYTATTELTIDSRKIQVFGNSGGNQDQVVGDNSLDSGQIESEVEVLRSESISLAVVRDLKLTDDPAFVHANSGLLMGIVSAVFGVNEDARELSDAERERIAVATLDANLAVRRVGLTYVLEISYRSPSPQQAARIANAVADAYVTDQLNTKYQAARRASVWLQERIAELRDQSNAAARSVQDYKQKNNIVETGGQGLLTSLQVQETNTQMITASATTAEAKARLERIQDVLKSSAPGEAVGTVSDTLKDEVITRLRQRYLDDSQRVAEWTARLGPDHLAVIGLRNEMAELQHSIVDELRRIAQTYQSDYEIAKAREDSIRASLGKQIEEAGANSAAQVDLSELQSTSQTYHTIFENFLQKYTEAVQQQSFPISDARVITAATPPLNKSYPKTTLIALLGLLVGLSAGLGHALIVRNFDRAVRRPRDVEEKLGLECLGMVPVIAADRRAKNVSKGSKILVAMESLALVPLSPNQAVPGPNLTRKVLEDPFCHFSEGLRSTKTALDILALTRPMGCVGVISAIPGEGKSTIAINLANLIAGSGRKTLLIDGDMRNPELSRQLGTDAKHGLLELIAGTVSLNQAARAVPQSTLQFVPTILQQRIANSGDLLASTRMRSVLEEARRDFQNVIIDLPPLGPVSDARAISPLVDAFIVVIKWGYTRFDVLEEALVNFGIASDKIVGVVLNHVDYQHLRNSEPYSYGYYYNKNYAKYGYSYSQD